MVKYIVTKKVMANEFLFVEASSKEEAIELATQGEGMVVCNTLEYAGDLPKSTWTAEDITEYRGGKDDRGRSTLLCD